MQLPKKPSMLRNVCSLTLSACLLLPACACAQSRSADIELTTEVQKALDSKRFNGVRATAKDGMVSLVGTVDLYATKEDAEHKIHHKKGVIAVHNGIEVRSSGSAAELSDVELRGRLAEKLTYDRVGYGTTTYNSFTIGVQNGVVTLGGVAYGPTDKDSAVSLVAHYPGVKDIVDDIEVAPVSPNDDRIRVDTARAVYGFPSLQRYAVDPAKPIRITVVNGNVTLTGVVEREADKDTAGIRAAAVPGAFRVTNHLQVADGSGTPR